MGLARNPCVRINEKAGGWISVTPLTAQPEPANLAAIKAEIAAAWPMTSLKRKLASPPTMLSSVSPPNAVSAQRKCPLENLTAILSHD
jgi:hypothetical protein